MLVSAFAEVVSLGAVLPFLGVLVAPDPSAQPLPYRRGSGVGLGHHLGRSIGVAPHSRVCRGSPDSGSNPHSFAVGSAPGSLYASGADLGIEVYRRTLYQPYRVHVARNSSDGAQRLLRQGWLRAVSGLDSSVADTGQLNSAAAGHYARLDRHRSDGGLGGGCRFRRQLRVDHLGVPPTASSQQPAHRPRANSGGQSHSKRAWVVFVMCCLTGRSLVYCDIYRKADLPLRLARGQQRLHWRKSPGPPWRRSGWR